MIQPGTVLQSRYRVQKQIGQGGMGAVYIATDERFGSTVAIKETFFSEAGFGKAFEREARLLNNLRHPALPRVSDHFADENGQFLVMEYIAGEDLSEMLEKKSGPFPLGDVLNWADQLLDALDFLHTQEMPVIHRDIKPQNLKLTPRGQIILLDFGLAKGNPTDAGNQTAAKSVFGFSRNYASVEQIQGTGTDPRSDLYSLAATLYHLLTGLPPVDALTRAMQVLNGDKDPLAPANAVHPQIPTGVAEVLQRAMDLNSNNRPSSAIAMRAMLSESDKSNFEAIPRPTGTGILTQNTEVFDSPKANQTQQAGVLTESLPIENSAAFPVQTEAETSIKPLRNNIQIPIEPKTAATVQSPISNTQSSETKRGMGVAAAAFGGVLLVGTALGGYYFLKPNSAAQNPANTSFSASNTSAANSIANETPANQVYAGSTDANVSNANVLNSSSTVVITKKDTPDKTPEKTSVAKAPTQSKEETAETPQTTETATGKNEAKVVMSDGEGNKVLEDGTIKSKDGTVVYPDGRVVKNGRTIVTLPPDRNRTRVQTPNIVMPPIPKEQLEKMTPEQRRKLRQILENQRRQGNPSPKPPQEPN